MKDLLTTLLEQEYEEEDVNKGPAEGKFSFSSLDPNKMKVSMDTLKKFFQWEEELWGQHLGDTWSIEEIEGITEEGIVERIADTVNGFSTKEIPNVLKELEELFPDLIDDIIEELDSISS